jgi:enamine deaminase RidA (YjgF/YER057c/UK114 family)
VRVGPHVFVAGTAPIMPEGGELPADAFGQTQRCLEIIVAALHEAGAGPEHVVRTRIFAASAEIFEEVARAHGAVFGDTRPACTYIVTQLIDPRWHVEIEAEALVA